MTILEKLADIQQTLIAPKDQRNNFGKYNYRTAEGILTAVKPLLKKHNLSLTLSDEITEVGSRIYVRATATLSSSADEVEVNATAYAREDESLAGMCGAQVTGAASSYARKYALNGLFAIDNAEQDPDSRDNTQNHASNAPKAKGNVIYPNAKQNAADAKKTASKPNLTEDMQNELDDLLAQVDFAQTQDDLTNIVNGCKGKPYYDQVRNHALAQLTRINKQTK